MKISSLFKPLSFLPALALMYMIYSFSAQPADSSSSTSYTVSRKLVQAVNSISGQGWSDWEIETHAAQIHGIVRKAAHITEYFLLAVAVSFPLYVYGVRGILLMLLAGIICVGYAFGDEYHQSIVAGRSASFRDVLIDSIGIFFGIILTRLIGWSGRMAITGPAYERRQKKQQKELDAREDELRRREDALRREEMRYRRERSMEQRRPYRSDVPENRAPGVNPYGTQVNRAPGGNPCAAPADHAPAENPPAWQEDHTARTRVIGTKHEVDDRTRVYRSEEEQRRMEEACRRQVYERRRVQSQELRDDSTSDQLSEDLPFSGLFRKR